jgi:hypothetical protein
MRLSEDAKGSRHFEAEAECFATAQSFIDEQQ